MSRSQIVYLAPYFLGFVIVPILIAALTPSWAILGAMLAYLLIGRHYAKLAEDDDIGLDGRCVPPFVALVLLVAVSGIRAAVHLLS